LQDGRGEDSMRAEKGAGVKKGGNSKREGKASGSGKRRQYIPPTSSINFTPGVQKKVSYESRGSPKERERTAGEGTASM